MKVRSAGSDARMRSTSYLCTADLEGSEIVM